MTAEGREEPLGFIPDSRRPHAPSCCISTAWRQLDAATQAAAVGEASARAVMLAHASVIKHPVVEWADGRITVGFDPEGWAARVRD